MIDAHNTQAKLEHKQSRTRGTRPSDNDNPLYQERETTPPKANTNSEKDRSKIPK